MTFNDITTLISLLHCLSFSCCNIILRFERLWWDAEVHVLQLEFKCVKVTNYSDLMNKYKFEHIADVVATQRKICWVIFQEM